MSRFIFVGGESLSAMGFREAGRRRSAGSLDSVTLKFQVSPSPCLRIRFTAYLRRKWRGPRACGYAIFSRTERETGCIVAMAIVAMVVQTLLTPPTAVNTRYGCV